MRVAVTGATGHVGVNLVRGLLARGDTVRVLTHRAAPEPVPDVENVAGDVLDPESLRRAFAGAEVVFHLAAVISIVGDPDGSVTRTNVTGAENAARAALAAGVRRFVHVASVHAFDLEPLQPPVTEATPRAVNPWLPAYDRSKAAGEAAVRRVFAEGLDGLIVHPSGVIGPADPRPSRMGMFFLDFYHRRLPALTDGGFDWVDVRDLCTGILAAAERGRSSESYILSGHWCSVGELTTLGQSLTGVRPPLVSSPMWLAKVGVPFITAWSRLTGTEPLYTLEALHALAANRDLRHDKAAAELGYAPRPLADTVRDLFTWFDDTGRLNPRLGAPR